MLDEIPARVEKINVGKKPHSNSMTQDEITRMMISLVGKGKIIARLKGGDALFFSRGSEEARAMRQRGIAFEIVPGISSAIGATTYAGIPLTHRDYSSSVLIATGQEGGGKGKRKIDWRSVPSSSVDTIVLLMGVERFPIISKELIRGGLDPLTPVAAIEWGTTRRQKTRFFKLNQKKVAELLRPPSVVVIGKVVGMAKELR